MQIAPDDERECARCGIGDHLVETDGVILCLVCSKFPDVAALLARVGFGQEAGE